MSGVWGPPTWTLFHALAAKIHEDKFAQVKPQLISFIKMICFNLPCPTCAGHAKSVLSKVDFRRITTPTMLQNFLHEFHNSVNKRKNKPDFDREKLVAYSEINLISAFNNFVSVFHTRGNMRMLAESFQRGQIVKSFKKWFALNLQHFNAPIVKQVIAEPVVVLEPSV